MGSYATASVTLSGEELRFARKLLGLTQEELGGRLGLSGKFVSHCEAGRKRIPAMLEERLEVVLRPTGQDLRAARQRLGWTQAQLARHLGLASGAPRIASWERGNATIPASRVLELRRLFGTAQPALAIDASAAVAELAAAIAAAVCAE